MILKSKRPSGCQVVTEVIPGARSVALGVMVAAGSRFEEASEHGASHLLEHLLFRGAERHDGDEIADLLDRLGGDSNAYTDKEVMTAYVRTLPERAAEALSLLVDVICRPSLDDRAVRSEQAVVADEILARDDEPADLAAGAFDALCFPGHPLGRDVLGTAEGLRRLDRQALAAFHAARYGADRLVVLGAGAVDHDEIARLADELVSLPAIGPVDRCAPGGPEPAVSIEDQAGGQAHLVLGVALERPGERDRAALAVLSQLLGGGVSSRMFREVREEQGLAYGVGTELSIWADAGSLSAFAATAPGTMGTVIEQLSRIFDEAAGGAIGDDEVDRAKEAIRTDLLMSADEPLARMARIGADALLLDAAVEIEDRARVLSEVSPDDVRRVARSLEGPRVASLVGPVERAAERALLAAIGR